MHMKRILTTILLASILSLICCSGISAQPAVGSVTNTSDEINELIEELKQVHKDNEELKNHVNTLEKEVDYYRDDVRQKSSELNDNMSHWLVLLSIIVTLIGVVLGVLAPIFLNNRNEKKLEELLNKTKEDLENKIKDVSAQVKKSEQAAQKAKVSQLFAEATSEENHIRAIALYDEVIRLDPNSFYAYNNRGALKASEGDNMGAMKDYDKAIKLNDQDEYAYYNRGNLKSDMGNSDGAMADYDKAIELNPNYAEAYNNRGDLKIKLENFDGAMADVEKAIELAPSAPISHITLAELYEAMAKDKKYKTKKSEYLAKAAEARAKAEDLKKNNQ